MVPLTADLKLIAKGAGIVFAGFAVSKLLSYFYRVLIARFLGPAELGVFSVGLAVLGIVTVFAALGLYRGVFYFVVVHESRGEREKTRGTILGSLKIQVFTSLLFAATMFGLSSPLETQVFQMPGLAIVIQLLALTIPFQVITSNLMILTQAFKRIKYRVLIRNLLENIVKVAITFALVFLGFGAAGASLALALSAAFAFVISIYIIQKYVYRLFSPKASASYNMRELFAYSWPLLAVGFFMIIMSAIDTISLGILSTAYNTGIYNVAMPTARILEIPGIAFLSLFLPVVTGLYATKKMDEFGKTYKTITRWVFSLALPASLFTVVFAREILSIMFGAVYAQGAAALSILAVGFLVFTSMNTVRSLLEPLAKTRLILYNTIATAVLNLVLNFALIPIFGMLGAALASTISYIFWSLLAFLEVYFVTKLHPFSRAYWKPTLASIIAIALFYFAREAAPAIDSFAFPAKVFLLVLVGAVFLAVYAVILLLIKGLQPEDIEILKAIEDKTGLRIPIVRDLVKRFI